MNTQFRTNIHQSALRGLANGIDLATQVVKKTLGPKGTNVAIEIDLPPYSITTNDGATIIQAIQMEDPLEKRGLAFLKEGVTRSNTNSGDGSTTTCVLLNSILQEALKQGEVSVALKESLDECLPIIERSIDEQKKLITADEVESVATIAGESVSLGKTLARIYKVIGKEGIIHLESSGTYDTSYSFIDGVRFNAGYLSPYMVHDEIAKKEGRKENKAVYENPAILVTKRKIGHLNDINPLIEALTNEGKKDLVIFTDDMDSGVASVMIRAHKEHIINILIIPCPVLWKSYIFEDFAKVTGATIVEESSGINFKNLELGHLGTCGRITTDREETVITGIADISEHIAELKEKSDQDSLLRLSWLTTKTAILKLGANSETELTYLRLKAEDAINASKLALEDGIVVGGGLALLNAARQLPETIGGRILVEALQEPIRQILANGGVDFTPLKNVLIETIGYDAKNDKAVDMYEAQIVDSAKIVKNAIRNALGIASTIITVSTVISIPPKTPEQIAAEGLANKRPF